MVGHHIYTNVFGADPDLPEEAEGDPRRLVHRQKWASMYRYQHLYLPPLYGILGLKVTNIDWKYIYEIEHETSSQNLTSGINMLHVGFRVR